MTPTNDAVHHRSRTEENNIDGRVEREVESVDASERVVAPTQLRVRFTFSKSSGSNESSANDAAYSDQNLMPPNDYTSQQHDNIEEGEIIESPGTQVESQQHHNRGHDPKNIKEEESNRAVDVDPGKSKPIDDHPTCRLCKKTFLNMKSLYGHMRIHDRNGRGINPPSQYKNASASTKPSQDPIVQRTGAGKRGSKGKEKAPEPIDEEHQAANDLLRLADECYQARASAKRDERRNVAMHHQSKVDKFVPQPSSLAGPVKAYGMKYLNQNTNRLEADLKEAAKVDSGACNKASSSPQDLRKACRITDTASVQTRALGTKHTCEQCGRTFPTGQALGGHKRAHYNPEKLVAMAADKINQASNPSHMTDKEQPEGGN